MHLDNWGLIVGDDADGKHTPLLVANHYIVRYFEKLKVDLEFKITHPQRPILEGEDFDEYDSYLSSHLDAYNDLLMRQGKTYLLSNDYDFNNKLQLLTWGDSELQVHPQQYPKMELNNYNLIPIMCALAFYGFTDVLIKQNVRLPHLKNIQLQRKNILYRYLGDIVLLLTTIIFPYSEIQAPQLLLAEKSPTIFSRIANRIFLTKYKQYSNVLEYLTEEFSSGKAKEKK